MPSSPISVLNFQQFIQLEAVNQGYPFFPQVVSVLFDENFYLSRYADVAAAVQNGLLTSGYQHFVTSGMFEGRTSSAFYDEDLYLLANPDIKAAVAAGTLVNGLQHHFSFGFYEGRDSLALTYEFGGIRLSSFFDETYYLTRNADIAAVVNSGIISYGFEHFAQFGLFEKGRNPSYYYNEGIYLSLNPDVAAVVAAGQMQNGLIHYLQFGHRENRTASTLFDPVGYLAANPDVAAAVNSKAIASAFQHFLEFGSQEGRAASLFYDEAYYRLNNADVAAAVASGAMKSGFEHFTQFGIKEGRRPSTFYSEADYLAANPDVQSAVNSGAFSNGLLHYLEFGRAENRPLSNTLNYADSTQAVLVNLANNTVNFLNYGANFKLMPLGDSITQGVDGTTAEAVREGYRLDLWQAFQDLKLNVDFVGTQSNGSSALGDKDNEGWPGQGFAFFQQAVSGYSSRIAQFIDLERPEVILLMLGTNEGNSAGSTIAGLLSGLLDTILANPTFTGDILVGTVAPIHPDSRFFSSRSTNLQNYNNAIPGVVAAKNTDRVKAVAVGSLLDNVADMAGVSPTGDNGLHPNDQGYSKMADAWYNALMDPALGVLVAQTGAIGNQANVTGSAYDDALIGDSGNNVFEGLLGDDVLTGGGGADEFVYGSPNQGFDLITDVSSNDLIKVSAQGFGGGLVAGFNLSQGSANGVFVKSTNPSPTNNKATFLYNTNSGVLSFDRDGQGAQAAIALLDLGNAFNLNANQIVVV